MTATNQGKKMLEFREYLDYLEAVENRGKGVLIGIDPGKTGAIAFLCGRKTFFLDIPTVVVEKGKDKKGKLKRRSEYDLYTLKNIFGVTLKPFHSRMRVFLERAQIMGKWAPRQDTPLTAFDVGWGAGMWHMLFVCFGIPFEDIPPAEWKKAMGLTRKGKEAARRMAQRIFPDIAESHLNTKSSHNRAEALLIAEFGRLKSWRDD